MKGYDEWSRCLILFHFHFHFHGVGDVDDVVEDVEAFKEEPQGKNGKRAKGGKNQESGEWVDGWVEGAIIEMDTPQTTTAAKNIIIIIIKKKKKKC